MMNMISSNRGSGAELYPNSTIGKSNKCSKMNLEMSASDPDVWGRSQAQALNMNHYANKKSAAESMLDVALLMANASQLKAVLEQGPDFSFYTPIVTLISISLCLQVTVGVLLIFIVRWNLNDEQKHWRLNVMENLATGLVFMIVVVNVFITAFGVHRPNRSD
ncbi:ninjurin-1 isoform X1 [Larimichthys crocea]|uniref:ninjurin-1 isoform X1 n=1 Tax=Larimichthys crocea TaxID=215358 RepID=UPI000900BA1F|nr:ninjurin-1 isoform X1 [Larimichthys crocea]